MKYRVVLGVGQTKRLRAIVRRGKHTARKIRRARSLLHSHEGMSASRIAALLDVHSDTVYRTRRLFVTGGLDAALEELPRSGQPRRLDGRGAATLIALACSSPPEGRAVWTMQLLDHARPPLPAESGGPARVDYENKRNGTCNLFGFFEPHRGWRYIKVTDRRTKLDVAEFLRELVEEHPPHAKKIRVILDNLNVHTVWTLCERYPALPVAWSSITPRSMPVGGT
jgi:hypothetical protein